MVWARRNVYSAPRGYYKFTATHGTPRGTHGGPRGVVQQISKGGTIPKGGFDTQPWKMRARSGAWPTVRLRVKSLF